MQCADGIRSSVAAAQGSSLLHMPPWSDPWILAAVALLFDNAAINN